MHRKDTGKQPLEAVMAEAEIVVQDDLLDTDKLTRCFVHTLRQSITMDRACAGVVTQGHGPSGLLLLS